MDILNQLLAELTADEADMIAIRRHLHQQPEILLMGHWPVYLTSLVCT